jgi:acetyl esterase/lipase
MSLRRLWARATTALLGQFFIPMLAALLFFGAMFWAKGRDPFHRIWFNVKAPGQAKAECVAVLPKMAPWPLPVVVYSHGSGGSWLTSGNELRQMAEMGLAAIDMDYDQTNEAAFEAQFAALLGYVGRQPWADTNRIAWVGLSLGAQRQLAFFLGHPGLEPKVLVRVSGGWIPELEQGTFNHRWTQINTDSSLTSRASVQGMPGGGTGPTDRLSPLAPVKSSVEGQTGSPPHVLLVHGENDEVFPCAEVPRVASVLQSNGIPAELKVMAGQQHGFEPNRLLLFRAIGEYCLTQLKGPDALGHYQSILAWQAKAKPLWLFWIPALLWLAYGWHLRRRAAKARTATAEQTGREPALRWWEIALRWVAAVLAVAALADTALHLVPPRLAITDRTLAIAGRYLVQPKEMADFDFLASLSSSPSAQDGSSVWRGKRLKTLLEHVELANYNRELIDWKLDDKVYREFVLSPQIDLEFDGDLNWRRPLWENFYPRIRKEQTTDDAAVIVARFLRERVSICDGLGGGGSTGIVEIWQRQMTDARGFEAVYVAALRSAGVPARLDGRRRAEFWTGSGWRAAPRPLVETVW